MLLFSHRHRHTEKEEDAELLEQTKHQKAIVHFEQSPTCEFLGIFYFLRLFP